MVNWYVLWGGGALNKFCFGQKAGFFLLQMSALWVGFEGRLTPEFI